MATSKTTTITKVNLNNSSTPTTVSIPTTYVVKDNMLVVDERELKPGVIIHGREG